VVPIAPHARHSNTKVCLAQKTHAGLHTDVWAVDTLRLMPVRSVDTALHMQFSLHLMCGLNARRRSNNRYSFRITNLLPKCLQNSQNFSQLICKNYAVVLVDMC